MSSPTQTPARSRIAILTSIATILVVTVFGFYWAVPVAAGFICWVFGIALSVLWLVVAERAKPAFRGVIVSWFVPSLAMACLVPMISHATASARAMSCQNNLKQFALALHNYHDDYGCFPPAYLTDAEGTPIHSWRVLILPYMEQTPLYEKYDFSQPWDSPANAALAASMPPVYRCPRMGNQQGTATQYVAVVGAGTIWPERGSATLAQCTDTLADTIQVVELTGPGVHWMSPEDSTLDALPESADVPHDYREDMFHRRRAAMVATVDGHVEPIAAPIDKDTLAPYLTIAGGELVTLGSLNSREFDPGVRFRLYAWGLGSLVFAATTIFVARRADRISSIAPATSSSQS